MSTNVCGNCESFSEHAKEFPGHYKPGDGWCLFKAPPILNVWARATPGVKKDFSCSCFVRAAHKRGEG